MAHNRRGITDRAREVKPSATAKAGMEAEGIPGSGPKGKAKARAKALTKRLKAGIGAEGKGQGQGKGAKQTP